MLMVWQNWYYKNASTTESNQYVQCNSYQNSNENLHWIEKSNLKLIWKDKRFQIAKVTMSKKSNDRVITIPNSKNFILLIKTICY
jgi:hypothetical protein